MTEVQPIVERTVFGHSPSDKMQVLGRGDLPLPGACVICGSGVCDDGYVFLGVHVDFHGALLLCATCLTQAGEKIGMIARIIADRIHAQAVELANDNARLRRENEAIRERLSVFDDALRAVGISSDSAGDSNLASENNSEPESFGNESSGETQSNAPNSESEPFESSTDDRDSESNGSATSDLTAGVSAPSSKPTPEL